MKIRRPESSFVKTKLFNGNPKAEENAPLVIWEIGDRQPKTTGIPRWAYYIYPELAELDSEGVPHVSRISTRSDGTKNEIHFFKPDHD